MTNSDNLISALEKYKDKNYSAEEFVTFIKGTPELKGFFDNSVGRFLKYQQTNPDLINRFVEDEYIDNDEYIYNYDYTYKGTYNKEEMTIIDDILKHRLILFYVLYCLGNNENILNTGNDLFRKLGISFCLNNESKKELIDYIINYGVISNNNIESSVKIKTILDEEEIEILRLRKNLQDHTYTEIIKHTTIKMTENGIKQRAMKIRNKLGASTIDEAVRIFEERYYKL